MWDGQTFIFALIYRYQIWWKSEWLAKFASMGTNWKLLFQILKTLRWHLTISLILFIILFSIFSHFILILRIIFKLLHEFHFYTLHFTGCKQDISFWSENEHLLEWNETVWKFRSCNTIRKFSNSSWNQIASRF